MMMKVGHLLTLLGAALVAYGTGLLHLLGMDIGSGWQHFKLADVTAMGYQVPPAGQIVLGLGALVGVLALAGLVTRKGRQAAVSTLFVSAFLIAWVIVAHVTRDSAFALMAFEEVTLLEGYDFASWGAALAFFGSLVCLAANAKLSPKEDFLRVALVWRDTVLEEQIVGHSENFTIGEGKKNDMVLPSGHLPGSFTLFRGTSKKGVFELGLHNELGGEVTIGGDTRSVGAFTESAEKVRGGVSYKTVGAGDWGTLELGDLAVFFQFVRPEPQKGGAAFLTTFDEYVTAALSVSFLIQVGALLAAIFTWEVDPTRLVVENQVKDYAFEADFRKLELEEEILEDGEEEDTTAKQAEGEEGKFGDPEEDPEKENIIPKRDGKFVDKIDPKKVGVLEFMSSDTKALSNLIDPNAAAFSNKLAVAMSGSGNVLQIGHGAGGLGFQGTGSGGGGDGGVGRIHGLGKMDTGGGMAAKAGLGKKKKRRVGKVRISSGAATGFCKKGDIARVVRRRAHAIRACYEKRLQVKPKLSGKLTARWTIKATGSVGGASASGSLTDGTVKNCVLRVIRRMRFKKPEGGVCIVKWPFVFSGG